MGSGVVGRLNSLSIPRLGNHLSCVTRILVQVCQLIPFHEMLERTNEESRFDSDVE